MLKFSGYSYLIRGQLQKSWGFYGVAAPLSSREVLATTRWKLRRDRHCIWGTACAHGGPPPIPNARPGGLRVVMTLEQACPPEYWRAQCAFKDSMIH